MNKKIIVFIYCLFSIPFMSIHGWETFDKLYECRSSSKHSEDGEGKLECWVCDKKNTAEPDNYRQAVIYCLYTSHTQKEKDLSGKLIDANAWIKLPIPGEIIKNNTTDDSYCNSQNFGAYPIGVDKVQFTKTDNATLRSNSWNIILRRGHYYTYVIITGTLLKKSLDFSLLSCKYKDSSGYITIINRQKGFCAYIKNIGDKDLNSYILSSLQTFNFQSKLLELQQQLFRAIELLDDQTVQSILNSYPFVEDLDLNNFQNEYNSNAALRQAITNALLYQFSNAINIVTLLLQFKNINVNFTNEFGHTMLYYAQQYNGPNSDKKTNVINILTQHGAIAQ